MNSWYFYYGFGIQHMLLDLGSIMSVLDYYVTALGDLGLWWTKLDYYIYSYYGQHPHFAFSTLNDYCSIDVVNCKEKEKEWILLYLAYTCAYIFSLCNRFIDCAPQQHESDSYALILIHIPIIVGILSF